MRKIYYYYDPVVQTNDYRDRFTVNYYWTDGKTSLWAGRHCGTSPTATLKFVRELVDDLNEPRPLFGWEGRIALWFYWRAAVRDNKKS